MAFLMRVELPDVPGSLGSLATALGSVGADIEAIEIVEHGVDGRAVDDVLLELPASVLPDMVVSACQKLDGVEVVWFSRYAAAANLHLDLEAVESLTQQPERALARLVELVPVVFRSDWGMTVQRTGGDVVVVDHTSAAPVVSGISDGWLPLPRGRRLDPPPGVGAWESAVLVGVPAGSGDRAVVAGRRGGPEFLDSEIARLAHLAALAVSIGESVEPEASVEPVESVEPAGA